MIHTTIDVVRESADKLTQETWHFWLLDFDLVLDTYEKATRPTIRHKFRDGFGYSRLHDRDATIAEANVPWPVDVVNEARAKLLALVAEKLRPRAVVDSRPIGCYNLRH